MATTEHTIEILSDYNPISRVFWVLVDGTRRMCLFCDSADGMDAAVAALREQLEAEDNPPEAPKVYSKLKLYATLSSLGYWDALSTWLKSQTVSGVNAYTALEMAQNLSSDHPLFAEYLSAAQEVLGVDAETVAQVLAACEVEG